MDMHYEHKLQYAKMVLGSVKWILAISIALMAIPSSSFSPRTIPTQRNSPTQLQVLEDSTSMVVATESWRQYVFPIVTAGVLIDIVLGSPIANSVLAPLQGDTRAASEDGDEQEQQSFGSVFGGGKVDNSKLRERVDSERVANAAIDKARNTLELRRYLDDRKTDYDRMEEMKKALDAGMQDLDSANEKLSKDLSEELEKRGKNTD